MVVVDLAHSATELLLAPLDRLPAWLELLVVSAATAVIALWVVKRTTDQRKLERARDLMTSTIYEMRLFMDSPRRVFSAQRRLVWYSARYTGRTLPALLVLAAPLSLLFLHLELRFSYRPAAQQALVEVEVAEGVAAGDVRLTLDGEGTVLGPVVDRNANVAWFRVDLAQPANTAFQVTLGEAHTDKLLIAAPGAQRISVERRQGWASSIAAGYEHGLSSELPFTRIAIDHEREERSVLWMPWWVTWMVMSIGVALPLRRPMGVVV